MLNTLDEKNYNRVVAYVGDERNPHALKVTIKMEDVKKVVWSCKGDKSPYPNDINLTFYKRFKIGEGMEYSILQYVDDTIIIVGKDLSCGMVAKTLIDKDNVCQPKERETLNISLLSKWNWRFLNDKMTIWYYILSLKFVFLMKLNLNNNMPYINASIWWKNI
ncbi:hypothetical protein CR513_30778, partial [Mucuna pruriens]